MALLVAASLLLIGNTIRLSIFTRRREVEVMRLVGATRWFIRWPFLIEGVVVGFMGGLVAILLLWIGKITIVDPLSSNDSLVVAQHNSTLAFPALIAILFGAADPRLDDRVRHHAAPLPAGSEGRREGSWRGRRRRRPGRLPRSPGSTSAAIPSKLPTFAPRSVHRRTDQTWSAKPRKSSRKTTSARSADTELGNASLQGMVRELRKRHKDRL